MSRVKLVVQLASTALGIVLGACLPSACSDSEPDCGSDTLGPIPQGNFSVTTISAESSELPAALDGVEDARIVVGADQVRFEYSRDGVPRSAVYDVLTKYE